MQVRELNHMLNFTYEKSSEEIRAACRNKIDQIRTMITEREQRVAKVREEYGINDTALISILTQAREASRQATADRASFVYNSTKVASDGKIMEESALIGAGVVNMLLTENDYIMGERKHLTKLELIVRNLRDLPNTRGEIRGHQLTNDELTFLGF